MHEIRVVALTLLMLPALALAAGGAANVDSKRLANADAEPGQWMSYSRTWDEQRSSRLKQINGQSVRTLGLAWYADLKTYRGVQATPLVIDGVLYNVSVGRRHRLRRPERARAVDFDPKVGPEWARLACCGPSARGIAAWNGKIYIGALDGRLIAIDARDGNEVWSVQTFDRGQAYSITGAPRVFDGEVVSATAAPTTARAASSRLTTQSRARSAGASIPFPAIRPTDRMARPPTT